MGKTIDQSLLLDIGLFYRVCTRGEAQTSALACHQKHASAETGRRDTQASSLLEPLEAGSNISWPDSGDCSHSGNEPAMEHHSISPSLSVNML